MKINLDSELASKYITLVSGDAGRFSPATSKTRQL